MDAGSPRARAAELTQYTEGGVPSTEDNAGKDQGQITVYGCACACACAYVYVFEYVCDYLKFKPNATCFKRLQAIRCMNQQYPCSTCISFFYTFRKKSIIHFTHAVLIT